jgi:hypothetical protein
MVLPALTYGAGYLLWKAPQSTLYGLDLAPYLSVRSLLEPGVVYVGSLLLAAVLAYAIGLERFARPLALRLKWVRHLPREVLDIAGWFGWLAVFAALLATYEFVNTKEPVVDPVGNMLYLPIHLIVAGALMRRVWGLLLGRSRNPEDERRSQSHRGRVVTACFSMALLFAHVPLALVFGALGPNPARRLSPVSVVLEPAQPVETQLFLVEATGERSLFYDPVNEEALVVPSEHVLRMTALGLSPGQVELLEMLRTQRRADATTVQSVLPGRDSIRLALVHQLERKGLVLRSETGDVWPARNVSETAKAAR